MCYAVVVLCSGIKSSSASSRWVPHLEAACSTLGNELPHPIAVCVGCLPVPEVEGPSILWKVSARPENQIHITLRCSQRTTSEAEMFGAGA